jgi:hypothetical protein
MRQLIPKPGTKVKIGVQDNATPQSLAKDSAAKGILNA